MKQIDMKHDEATNTAVEKLFTIGELEQEEPAAPMRQQSWDKLIREERVMKVEYLAMVENVELENQVKVQYAKLRAKLATENDTAIMIAVKDFYKEVITELTRIRTQFIINLPRPAAAQEAPSQPVQQQGGAGAAARIQPELKDLKLGAPAMPKFDGTARN